MPTARPGPRSDSAGLEYLKHSSAPRINTDIVMTQTLRRQYPELHVVPVMTVRTPLLSYASSGFAEVTALPADHDPALATPLVTRQWLAPLRRTDSALGQLGDQVIYGKFEYKWKKHEFLLYLADSRDGGGSYPVLSYIYIISADEPAINSLITECSSWAVELHNEIWVYDQGFWQKDSLLWQAVQSSEWKDIILDEDKKKAIRYDVNNFYNSKDTYKNLHVPWKRGLIFHGPPGNGKTISVKAIMHELYRRDDPIPTLYVRSLVSYAGPLYAISQIFIMARRQAPCFLVFEDIDSIITDGVRSYFLNEVDGLSSNDGILMIASTNHLDRLDPGLSKRPSRFDRKYAFLDPNFDERTQYAQYWQKKLADSPEVEFPDELCPAVADITEGFSFAYMQEAFVASLLALARAADSSDDNTTAVFPGQVPYADVQPSQTSVTSVRNVVHAAQRVHQQLKIEHQRLLQAHLATNLSWERLVGASAESPNLDDVPLWRELVRQIAILREGMGNEDPKGKPNALSAEMAHLRESETRQSTTLLDDMGRLQLDQYARVSSTTRTPEGMLMQIQQHAERTGEKIYLDH